MNEHRITTQQRKFETPGSVLPPEDRIPNEIMYNGIYFSNFLRKNGPDFVLNNGTEAYGMHFRIPKTHQQNRLYVIRGNGEITVFDKDGFPLRDL